MFWNVWKQIWAGKTPMRAFMNLALESVTVAPGLVLDLGGGRNPSYLRHVRNPHNNTLVNIDKQHARGKGGETDFEHYPLPYAGESVDQIFLLNVLEHIYHHQFLMNETRRVLKPGGTLVGFVPFLISYHADPHDYFRYTFEALEKIFAEAGFSKVEIRPLGRGPFAANLNNLAATPLRFLVPLAWPGAWLLDAALLALRPALAKRFPLGYRFVLAR